MSSLLAEIVPMAVAAAISPVILILQLNTLTGRRPLARGAAVTVGAAGVLIVVSSLGVSLGGTGFSTNDALQGVIKLVFGGLLMAIGVRALVRPRPPQATPASAAATSIGRSFAAGAIAMASNLTTFALYIPALALIAGSDLGPGERGLAALVILLITLTVAWVPLLAATLIPGATERWLPATGRWMTANDRWIKVVLGFGFGIALAVAGIGQL
jgi:hypothetical protein